MKVVLFRLLAFVTSTAVGEDRERSGLDEIDLVDLASLFVDTFDNELQYLDDLRTEQLPTNFHSHVRSKFVNATGMVPAIATAYGAKATDPILYLQQWEYSSEQQTQLVYRQRLHQLSAINSSTIALTIWQFEHPDEFRDAWDYLPGVFERMPRSEVTTDLNCRVYFRKVAPRAFQSHMLPNCWKDGNTYIILDYGISETHLTTHEHWHDSSGQQVFGTKSPYNETRLVDLSQPTWPPQWHAEIMITGTRETSELEVDVIDLGRFYYDWNSQQKRGRSAMLMQNISTGEITRDVNLDGTFYYINDGTGACFHFKIPDVYGPVAPTWVHNFAFNETQYLLKSEGNPGARWEASSHWQRDAFNAGMDHLFNYWNLEDKLRTPSRIMGPSFTEPPYGHSFIELEGYHVSFNDVPNWQQLFKVPTNCSGVHPVLLAKLAAKLVGASGVAPTAVSDSELEAVLVTASSPVSALSIDESNHLRDMLTKIAARGGMSAVALLSERASKRTELEGTDVKQLEHILQSIVHTHSRSKLDGTDSGFAAGQNYPSWPPQFVCNHTGNGVSFGDVAYLTERGVFYYDSPNARSCRIYYDNSLPHIPQTKKIVEGGSIYTIDMQNGTCAVDTIPFFGNTSGPVRPDFMKNFVRQKDQYCLRNRTAFDPSIKGQGSVTYARTSHWTSWSFAASPSHAFHSWVEIKNGMPFQVLTPGMTLPPFGFAFVGYENVNPSFVGIDLNDVFQKPSSCHHHQLELDSVVV